MENIESIIQGPAITKHLKNIFDEGELKEDSVSSILEHTAEDPMVYILPNWKWQCGNYRILSDQLQESI